MIYHSTECKVLVKKDIVIKEFDYDNKDFLQVHEDLDDYRLIPRLRDVIVKNGRYLYIVERIKNIDEPIRKKHPKNTEEYFCLLDEIFGEKLPKDFYSYEKELLVHSYTIYDHHIGNFGYINGQIVCLDEGSFIKEDDAFMNEMLQLFDGEK